MQLTKRLIVVAALALLLVLCCGAATGGASSGAPRVHRFLWGAWIGKQFTGTAPPWDWNAVTDFDTTNAGGRHLNLLHWGVGVPWVHQFRYWKTELDVVRSAGALSLLDLGTGFATLRSVADGAYDSAWETWATEAKSWGHTLLLRFDFEMNGGWYPWGTTPRNRNTAADFVAAWRHVHNIFQAAGASNVKWVWCPNIDPHGKFTSLASLYPGRQFVNWTCLDGYNWGAPWESFAYLYRSSYHQIMAVAPGKPMLIGEVASAEQGGNKARWIRSMFNALPTKFPRVQGISWYDKLDSYSKGNWPIESSRASSAAFSAGIGRTLARTCRDLRGDARALCLTGAMP